ncbi:chitin deacetylase [Aspergillus sclerotialis]|uniref:Chitin deacetylase n=1 Tax=Aspergillus sclerotialis TaxID=2070753 RepID=A0A3A2ZTJ1_9EURO|nr:chitin deacetylase [Aspergillus sclerotialis]
MVNTCFLGLLALTTLVALLTVIRVHQIYHAALNTAGAEAPTNIAATDVNRLMEPVVWDKSVPTIHVAALVDTYVRRAYRVVPDMAGVVILVNTAAFLAANHLLVPVVMFQFSATTKFPRDVISFYERRVNPDGNWCHQSGQFLWRPNWIRLSKLPAMLLEIWLPTSTGSVVSIPRPAIGNVPYGQIITSCVNDGDIAITFDDGPSTYTSDLLDMLASYGVRATFFIVGNNGNNGVIDQVAQWTSDIQRMNSEGHQVASHTYTHPDLMTLTSAARRDQMYQNEQALFNVFGKIPTYMRPPYLAFNGDCAADMTALGYHVISTNLDTKDYANDSPVLILN